MAGHSHFKSIMHKKEAKDAKRSICFAKCVKEIAMAVKAAGITNVSDAYQDRRIKNTIINAQNNDMPKENIVRTIEKAIGTRGSTSYEKILYECIGPKKVIFLIEAVTDNKNRVFSSLRGLLNKHNYNILPQNSILHLFELCGIINYKIQTENSHKTIEDILEKICDYEIANNKSFKEIENIFFADNDILSITVDYNHFAQTKDKLTDLLGECMFSQIIWQPKEYLALPESEYNNIKKLLNILEEEEDISYIWHNMTLKK